MGCALLDYYPCTLLTSPHPRLIMHTDVVFWKRSFEEKPSASAETMTPIGGYVLKHHVFKTSEPIA